MLDNGRFLIVLPSYVNPANRRILIQRDAGTMLLHPTISVQPELCVALLARMEVLNCEQYIIKEAPELDVSLGANGGRQVEISDEAM